MEDKLQVGFKTMYSTEGREITEKDISMTIKIAGISNYVTTKQFGKMSGVFPGYIKKESDNPVDSKAIAIYTKDDKHIGYVPRTELQKVSDFSEGTQMPCLLQILPFMDKDGKIGMKGKAILLKLYEGKVDLMQKFIDERGVQLLHETSEELTKFQGLFSNEQNNADAIGIGEELEDEFDFSIYSYAVAPSSEKSASLEDNIIVFNIEDINCYINVVFIEPEEKGCFAGYVLNGEVYNNEGFVIGHVPENKLSAVNALAKGRKLFCLYTVLDSLTPKNEICLSSNVIAFKLFEDDDTFNYLLLGTFSVKFMEAANDFAKSNIKKKAMLTQHGEKLEISNEYYDNKKQTETSQKPTDSSNGGCLSTALALAILFTIFLLAI